MALLRQWIKTDDGEYLVLAGYARAVLQASEGTSSAMHSDFFLLDPSWLLRPLLRRFGRGRVEVRWRDEVWAWDTPDEHEAHLAANRVESRLRTGEWVPRRMPQPDIAGAERIEHIL